MSKVSIFNCPKCDKNFKYKSDLIKHLERKTSCINEEQKFICIACNKEFKYKRSRDMHQKTACEHKNELNKKIEITVAEYKSLLKKSPVQNVNNYTINQNTTYQQQNIVYNMPAVMYIQNTNGTIEELKLTDFGNETLVKFKLRERIYLLYRLFYEPYTFIKYCNSNPAYIDCININIKKQGKNDCELVFGGEWQPNDLIKHIKKLKNCIRSAIIIFSSSIPLINEMPQELKNHTEENMWYNLSDKKMADALAQTINNNHHKNLIEMVQKSDIKNPAKKPQHTENIISPESMDKAMSTGIIKDYYKKISKYLIDDDNNMYICENAGRNYFPSYAGTYAQEKEYIRNLKKYCIKNGTMCATTKSFSSDSEDISFDEKYKKKYRDVDNESDNHHVAKKLTNVNKPKISHVTKLKNAYKPESEPESEPENEPENESENESGSDSYHMANKIKQQKVHPEKKLKIIRTY